LQAVVLGGLELELLVEVSMEFEGTLRENKRNKRIAKHDIQGTFFMNNPREHCTRKAD
jgi:hypothetical protein